MYIDEVINRKNGFITVRRFNSSQIFNIYRTFEKINISAIIHADKIEIETLFDGSLEHVYFWYHRNYVGIAVRYLISEQNLTFNGL